MLTIEDLQEGEIMDGEPLLFDLAVREEVPHVAISAKLGPVSLCLISLVLLSLSSPLSLTLNVEGLRREAGEGEGTSPHS